MPRKQTMTLAHSHAQLPMSMRMLQQSPTKAALALPYKRGERDSFRPALEQGTISAEEEPGSVAGATVLLETSEACCRRSTVC